MKLFEHPDFEQAILRATEHFQNRRLRAAIIEKDYYVTEALRLIAITAPDKIIFKGGTSLAKGWNLIQRFSEDIDIFLDPLAFRPRLGKNAIDRELKKLRDTVGAHAALTFVADESKTIGGFGRNDLFSYIQRFGGAGEAEVEFSGKADRGFVRFLATNRSYGSQLECPRKSSFGERMNALQISCKTARFNLSKVGEHFINPCCFWGGLR